VLGAVLSKGLNGPVIFLSPFSKRSQRGCVNGFIFTFGVVQFLIGRLATIPSRIAPYIQLTLSGAVHASGYDSTWPEDQKI
jgi:hypothetical protein